MISRCYVLAVLLLLAPAVAAETIYKYRRVDGQTIYSNRLLPGAELIESFEYKFAAPAATGGKAPKSGAAAEERIKKHLAALDKGWSEVQEATKALAAAEARLSAGVGPLEGEGSALAGPAKPASPAVGGPQTPAPAAEGGQSAAAPAAVGGPMGSRRGGGRNAEYLERTQALEADVKAARARLDAALRRYNQLR